MVGNLARSLAVNPGRIINAAPNEDDFDILFRAAIINALDKVENPLVVTLGFPLSTYAAYKQAAEAYLGRRHFLLEYDSRTYNLKGGIKKCTFDVDLYDVIPEIVGGIIGLKKTMPELNDQNFIALSFGFGTMEGALATREGLVHRASFSSHGMRYVIGNLSRELGQQYYLNMKNEHQMDDAFVKGSMLINRKRVDLSEMKKRLLQQYYKSVVSPLIRKHFSDNDLEQCQKIYLMGGGALNPEIVDAIREDFDGFLPVEVAPYPEKIISIGYLYNSLRVSDQKPARCLGIDLGNASTVVSYFGQPEQKI